MSPQNTLKYFAYVQIVLALVTIFIPDIGSAFLRFPPPADHNIFFVGLLLGVVAYYFLRISKTDNLDVHQATVVGRIGVEAAMLLAIAMGKISPAYLSLVVIDIAGALWTASALRKSGISPFRLF